VTLLYCPALVPVTVTLKVQLPPAESEPPIRAMVLVDAVVVNVPEVHCVVDESAMESPAGKTSLKATPVKA
jgi:hypothetical protein